MVVVLPTPPFWLHIEITRALPWVLSGRGSGMSGIGRPVGPRTTSSGASVSVATSTASGSATRSADRSAGASTGCSAGCSGTSTGAVVVAVGNWRGSPPPEGAGGRINGGISGAPLPNRDPNLFAPLMVGIPFVVCRCDRSDSATMSTYLPAARATVCTGLRRQQADRARMTPSSKSVDGLCVAPRRERTSSASPVRKPVHGGSQPAVARGTRTGAHSRARGCAAAYTSRRLSTVTSV